ncbi:PLP-dependent aminotransferase family protein [Sphingopyxis terrae]|uniref:aminotransferase-like domain-containing protein n=1 Tax=Sphingopyxis terrae TaxID=33052 RepID=UPI0020C4CD75|nr:PLP-dependent aminotransferase family protein [Sphingopyxis terrae]
MVKKDWFPDLDSADGPKYLAIAESMAAAIEAGDLRGGDRLPPQRDLAARLGVDLTTVTKAYDQARNRGLIVARGRAGSFVLPQDVMAAGPPPRDTGMNMPPEVEGGSLLALWERTTSALLSAPGAGGRLHYVPAGGSEADRIAGTKIFERVSLASHPDEVIVTSGSQNALHAIIGAALAPGDTVACGPYVYPGFLALARKAGLKLAPMTRIEAANLEALCRTRKIAALYLVPTNDNPTTTTLNADERAAIAEVALRHAIQIIEDDAYGLLDERPLAPLASLVPELGWYIATSSKIISPALRVAHVRAPSLRQAMALAAVVHDTNVMAPPLNAALLTCWVEDGRYDRLIAETRAEAKRRQALAAEILPPASYAAHPCGYHLWVSLGDDDNAAQIGSALAGAGMTAISADSFSAGDMRAPAVRVSLGGAIDTAGLRRGLTMLSLYLTSAGPLPPVI